MQPRKMTWMWSVNQVGRKTPSYVYVCNVWIISFFGAVVSARVTEKQLMWANGGPGVYVCDYRKYYDLKDDDWKFDTIPEFMDGKYIGSDGYSAPPICG